ncbi:MAG TPA: polysaccharide deacetylase family protein [Firmicutes bacterium]|nr:polysaccharide deacetylase family protein [Candidatus Fermentithermobacillaceae bacterium]
MGFAGAKRVLRAALVGVLVISALVSQVPGLARPAVAAGSDLSSLFSSGRLIRRGDRGDLVRLLQEALAACGYRVSADGVFGPQTESAVKEFQRQSGLYVDGVAGPKTLAALEKAYYRANPPDKHIVKPGETLSAIASRYGTTVEVLARLNRISNPDRVYVGQVLLISKGEEEQEEPAEPPYERPHEPPAVEPLPAPEKRICLTFDDGPDLTTTRPILAILRQYGIKATFFLIGERVLRYPELAREIAEEGHVIGVHGFEHKPLAGLPASEVRRDLAKARDAIVETTGVTPYLYRPPLGALDETQVIEASKLDMRVTMWTNIGGADLGASSAEEVVSRTVSRATDGGIIMLHEGLQHTVEALPTIIETLARLGYGFQNP